MQFSQFMYEWLYGENGYYTKYHEIGKGGDFFTAVSTTPLFGGAIAKYIQSLIEKDQLSRNAQILEIGAHRGYLLADIVQFLYTFDPSLIESLTFAIYEPQSELRDIQKRYIEESFGDAIFFMHYSNLEDIKAKEGFIVANEILDAFACDLVYKGKMAYVEDFEIEWGEMDSFCQKFIRKYGMEKGEIARGYEEFANKLFRCYDKAHFLTFDYGDKEPRGDFSIRVYTKHQVFPLFDEKLDLKRAYKRSDITYDVNFLHVQEAFEGAGWQENFYKTQLATLIDFGIMEILQEILDKKGFDIYKQELEKVKILIHPSQMGERFKAISFTKG